MTFEMGGTEPVRVPCGWEMHEVTDFDVKRALAAHERARIATWTTSRLLRLSPRDYHMRCSPAWLIPAKFKIEVVCDPTMED